MIVCPASERRRGNDTQKMHLRGGTGRGTGSRDPPSVSISLRALLLAPGGALGAAAAAVAGESERQLRLGAAPSAAEMPANLPAGSEPTIINALFPSLPSPSAGVVSQ